MVAASRHTVVGGNRMGMDVTGTKGAAGKSGTGGPPQLTPGALRYQQGFDALWKSEKKGPEAFANLKKLGEALTPADRKSLRLLGAYKLREQATVALADPAQRDAAKNVLAMLDRGVMPAGMGMVINIETGEPVPQKGAEAQKGWAR
jgi:hypothetical protein